MILALLEMIPKHARRQDAIDIFLSVQGIVRFKPGCLSSSFTSSVDDDKLSYVEKWRTEKEFSAHLRSIEYLRILNALEYSSEPPTVCFYEVRNEKGIELIKQIRHDTETMEA